jgi:hypothetical protein
MENQEDRHSNYVITCGNKYPSFDEYYRTNLLPKVVEIDKLHIKYTTYDLKSYFFYALKATIFALPFAIIYYFLPMNNLDLLRHHPIISMILFVIIYVAWVRILTLSFIYNTEQARNQEYTYAMMTIITPILVKYIGNDYSYNILPSIPDSTYDDIGLAVNRYLFTPTNYINGSYKNTRIEIFSLSIYLRPNKALNKRILKRGFTLIITLEQSFTGTIIISKQSANNDLPSVLIANTNKLKKIKSDRGYDIYSNTEADTTQLITSDFLTQLKVLENICGNGIYAKFYKKKLMLIIGTTDDFFLDRSGCEINMNSQIDSSKQENASTGIMSAVIRSFGAKIDHLYIKRETPTFIEESQKLLQRMQEVYKLIDTIHLE